jgi:SPP1 gp7 family putative phage head morphogenesis protein
MNLDDWKPVRRNTSRYLLDLEAYVQEFLPWSLREATPRSAEAEAAMQEAAQQIAERMVARVAKTNVTSWRAAAAQSHNGRRIYAALREEIRAAVDFRLRQIIARNAALIVSLPDRLAQQTAFYIASEQRRGLRSEAIAKKLVARLPEMRKSVVKRLARTEVAKAETALTQARAERLGLPWYEWATSEDARVRPSHRKMDKILVAWADAPAPEQLAGEASRLGHYHPGGAPNCRCLALPLVDLGEVAWPHRIYAHGTVTRVSLREFEKFAGLPLAA